MATRKTSSAKQEALAAAGALSSGAVGEVKPPRKSAKASDAPAAKTPKFAKAEAAAPSKKAAAKKAAEPVANDGEAVPRGRAPGNPEFRLNLENDGRVKRGFTREFADQAKEMGARGKKVALQDLFAHFTDTKTRAQLMDAYYDCVKRDLFTLV